MPMVCTFPVWQAHKRQLLYTHTHAIMVHACSCPMYYLLPCAQFLSECARQPTATATPAHAGNGGSPRISVPSAHYSKRACPSRQRGIAPRRVSTFVLPRWIRAPPRPTPADPVALGSSCCTWAGARSSGLRDVLRSSRKIGMSCP